jgi:hypothetical protein
MTRDWTKAAAAAVSVDILVRAGGRREAGCDPEFSGDLPLLESAPNGVTAPCTIGKAYPFHLSGISFLDIGGSAVQANGEVFIWRRWRTSLATTPRRRRAVIVDSGKSSAAMRNQHGVVINSTPQRKALRQRVGRRHLD